MTDPLPTLPFYNVPAINNLRDAASSLHTPSGPIRTGILFRSAEVSKLSPSGWSALHSIGISHVFDLRSKPEVERGWAGVVGPHANGTEDVRLGWMQGMQDAGVERSWVPVFKAQDYSPERLAERYVKYMATDVSGFVAAYCDILRNGGEAYRTILLHIAGLPLAKGEEGKEEKIGALVHCTAGKDRTGIFFGILFDFLGVLRADIAKEYHLTERGLAHVREDVVARLLQTPGFRQYMASLMKGAQLSSEDAAKIVHSNSTDAVGDDVDFPPEVREQGRQAALRMVGAREESMMAALEMVDREFGGAEKYMRTICGLDDGDLERLRDVLVVKG